MGIYVGGQCVSLDAGLGSIPTALQASAVVRVEKIGGVWKSVYYSRDAATESFVQVRATPVPVGNYPYCDEDAPFYDGLAVGWLLAAVVVTAWGLRMARQAAR